MSDKRRKLRGFYREALRASREIAGDSDELKRRLLEEWRKRPGEVRMLLQLSRLVLQKEAQRERTGEDRHRETAEKVMRMMDHLRAQIEPGLEERRKMFEDN